MTNRILTTAAFAAFAIAFSPAAYGVVEETLVITDGLGNSVELRADTTTFAVSTAGSSGAFPVATPRYPTATGLVVQWTVGQFTIDATGKGRPDVLWPTLANLNQINATSQGSGTLTSTFTTQNYPMLGSHFLMAASLVED